jgi:hypothetical protein
MKGFVQKRLGRANIYTNWEEVKGHVINFGSRALRRNTAPFF